MPQTDTPAQQTRIVAKNGSDTTGNGSWSKPYLTITAALASITDAATVKNYIVFVMPGRYVEATGFTFKQDIHVIGMAGNGTVQINPVRVTVSDATITTTFTGGGAHQIILANMTFTNKAGGTNFVFTADNTTNTTNQVTCLKCSFPSASGSALSVSSSTTANVIVNLDDSCVINGALNVTGNTGQQNAVYADNNCALLGTMTVTAGGLLQVVTGSVSAAVNVTDSALIIYSAQILGTVTLTGTAAASTANIYQSFYQTISVVNSGASAALYLSACTPGLSSSLGDATLSASGASASISADAVSLPSLSSGVTLSGGATLTKITDAYGVHYTPGVSGNWSSPPTATNTALDFLAVSGIAKTQTANTALAGPTSGGAALPTFRALVVADIPALPYAAATTGDIALTSFSAANNVSSPANVTGLAFSTGTIRSFEALVSISIVATASLFEVYKLYGVYNGTSWNMAQTSNGDASLLLFTITNAGQVQYTDANYSGFSSATVKFRAIVTTQ